MLRNWVIFSGLVIGMCCPFYGPFVSAVAAAGGTEVASPPGSPSPSVAPEPKGPPSIFDDGRSQHTTQNASIVVRISTPHCLQAQDVFTLYPYPVKPPKVDPPTLLCEDLKGIKSLLLNSGYVVRANPDKPYPMGGWRWQYCYHAAVKKSGLSVPHTILTMYPWVDRVAPFALRETQMRNAYEKQRYACYQRALEEFEKSRADTESQAVSRGLYPIALSHRQFGKGEGELPPGSWWLQVTRKTPGLTYYWLDPLTVTSGQQLSITCDENSAMAINGGW